MKFSFLTTLFLFIFQLTFSQTKPVIEWVEIKGGTFRGCLKFTFKFC
jgi:hypothetical protein